MITGECNAREIQIVVDVLQLVLMLKKRDLEEYVRQSLYIKC